MPERFAALSLLLLLSGWHAVGAAEAIPPGVEKAAAKLIPGLKPDAVSPSPVPGLYTVAYGPVILYVSEDGRYVVRGDLLDVEAGKNLTEAQRKAARVRALDKLGDDAFIAFAPARVKHTVTVFTDVTCPYCRRLHREIQQYLDRGIAIRYAAFPRAGVPSKAYTEMVSVWCSQDRRKAITDAKAGRPIPGRQCDNPVKKEYELGRLLGVRGTPTLITDEGTVIPGYVPAARLARGLDAAGGS